jgi:hypothetical protein
MAVRRLLGFLLAHQVLMLSVTSEMDGPGGVLKVFDGRAEKGCILPGITAGNALVCGQSGREILTQSHF